MSNKDYDQADGVFDIDLEDDETRWTPVSKIR